MFNAINKCHNVEDFRNLAKRKLPSPIFHYIDGAADDEVTYKRNTESYEKCDLVPNVLRGIKDIDMSTTVMCAYGITKIVSSRWRNWCWQSCRKSWNNVWCFIFGDR